MLNVLGKTQRARRKARRQSHVVDVLKTVVPEREIFGVVGVAVSIAAPNRAGVAIDAVRSRPTRQRRRRGISDRRIFHGARRRIRHQPEYQAGQQQQATCQRLAFSGIARIMNRNLSRHFCLQWVGTSRGLRRAARRRFALVRNDAVKRNPGTPASTRGRSWKPDFRHDTTKLST